MPRGQSRKAPLMGWMKIKASALRTHVRPQTQQGCRINDGMATFQSWLVRVAAVSSSKAFWRRLFKTNNRITPTPFHTLEHPVREKSSSRSPSQITNHSQIQSVLSFVFLTRLWRSAMAHSSGAYCGVITHLFKHGCVSGIPRREDINTIKATFFPDHSPQPRHIVDFFSPATFSPAVPRLLSCSLASLSSQHVFGRFFSH